jgi:Uma2 family endonuclease
MGPRWMGLGWWQRGGKAMATSTMVPLDVYLHTCYEHDPDWVDGELRERGRPDEDHGYFQGRLVFYFTSRIGTLGLRAFPEVRMKISPTNYRLPDVMLIPAGARFLPTITCTPVICIEVLSADERTGELREKIRDFLGIGVGAVWVVDPRRRTMRVADGEGEREVEEFMIPGSEACLTKAELFAELDGFEAQIGQE